MTCSCSRVLYPLAYWYWDQSLHLDRPTLGRWRTGNGGRCTEGTCDRCGDTLHADGTVTRKTAAEAGEASRPGGEEGGEPE